MQAFGVKLPLFLQYEKKLPLWVPSQLLFIAKKEVTVIITTHLCRFFGFLILF